MVTNQPPQGIQHPKPSSTALGFALGGQLRIVCSILGVALMGFGCFSAVRDEPNYVALAALLIGFGLFAAGVVGRFGRFAYQSSEGTRLAYEFDYPTSLPRESVPELAAPPPATPAEANPTGSPIAVSEQGMGSDTVQVEKREPLAEAYTALDDKDYHTFASRMREAIEAESDPNMKVALDAFRLERLYAAGQTERLQELEALRDKHPTSFHPVVRIGDCHDLAGEHEKAAGVYGEGYEITRLDPEQRVTLLSRQANALRAAKLFEKAEKCLTNGLERAATDGEKAEVEKLLAEHYEAWGKQNETLLHFERALELNAGDVDARFQLAYRYNRANYQLAAFHHYEILRNRQGSALVLNNLAAILSALDMPITTARFYRRAWEHKETLAAANLAAQVAEAGLVDEAKELLANALKEGDVNQRVHQVSLNVARWVENEKERLKRIGEAGAAERSLVLKRFEVEGRQFSPPRAEDIEGTWKTSVGEMTFQRKVNVLVARFKDDIWDWELSGVVSQRTYSFKWKCDRASQNQNGDGFLVFRTDSEFEGIIRHTPTKGEARLVNGADRKPPPAPNERPEFPSPVLQEFLRRRLPPSPPSPE